jgi:CPA2 family monovalent cation:H+ antiporter-2
MNLTLLTDILIILGLSLVVITLFHRIKLPVILGFLLTGILAGPHGLALIKGAHEVEVLAEIGVVLLLFTIGIEFSLKSLLRIARSVFLGGALQVGLTILAVFLIARAVGQGSREAIFIGFLVSLSSTAMVLKLLQDRAEVDGPHGQTSLAVLVFQDLAIVPMMLLTPFLAFTEGDVIGPLLGLLGKGAGIVLLAVLGARFAVPWLLDRVTRTRSREVFVLTVVLLGAGAAWLSYAAGLSLALGAFIAGLVISESEYSAHALGEVLPFKDLFISFFFVSIGMLLDASLLAREPALVAGATLLVIGLKTTMAALVVIVLGFPLRTAVLVGLALSQVGEFSFILSKVGLDVGLLAGEQHQLFLAICVVTMALTPFLISWGPAVASWAGALPLPKGILQARGRAATISPEEGEETTDHLIVVGYGINGHNLARTARVAGIPYHVVELNPQLAREAQRSHEPVIFGDATKPEVLEHAGVERARVLVTAISDPSATRGIINLARRMNPGLFILTRTRYVGEVEELYRLGANHVIPEEFETSVEILARVLRTYLIPRYEIERFVAEVRSGGYEMLRSLPTSGQPLPDLHFDLPETEVATVRISGSSFLVDRTLAQAGLREEFGITLLALRRGQDTVANPPPDTQFLEGDLLIVFGRTEDIANAAALARGADSWET